MSLENSRRRKETTTSGGVVLLCTNGLKSKLQSRKLVPAFDQSPSELLVANYFFFKKGRRRGPKFYNLNFLGISHFRLTLNTMCSLAIL